MERLIHKNPDFWSPGVKKLLDKIIALQEGKSQVIDFSDLLLSFCVSEDPTSIWFQQIIKSGFPIEPILSMKKINREEIKSAKKSTVIVSDEQRKKLKFSISANRVLKIALQTNVQFTNTRRGREVDADTVPRKILNRIKPKDVMAALIFGDHGHEKQIESWGIFPKEWAKSFIWFLKYFEVSSIPSIKKDTNDDDLNEIINRFWLKKYSEKFGPYISSEEQETQFETDARNSFVELMDNTAKKGNMGYDFVRKYDGLYPSKRRNEVKVKLPKPSEVKVELPKPSEVKVESPKPSEVKVKLPKPSEVKVESPKPSEVKVESPKPSEVKVESPKPSESEPKKPGLNIKGALPKESSKEITRDGGEVSILSDKYTTVDELQYWPYVYALYKFIMGSSRKNPITISVQAPWGGGKTSFMRMLQKLLDPNYLEPKATAEQLARVEQLEKQIQKLESKSELNTKQVKEPTAYTKFLEDYDTLIETPFDSDNAFKISEKDENENHRLTVWFNAWKYEESDQIWAGFAHHLIEEITNRLKPDDQKKFWINYRKEKINKEEIKNKIDEMLNEVVETRLAIELPKKILKLILPVIGGLIVSGLTIILSPIVENGVDIVKGIGSIGAIISVGSGIFASSWQKQNLTEKLSNELRVGIESRVFNESIKPIISVPDYSKKLGYAYSVEEDIKFIIESVPKKYRPITIFIDDLDRCPPDKVAKIMETLNRMVASDIPHCNFILGVDAQLVAAALENAYDPIIEKMPKYAKRVPIGIKFMDKFVQLPVLVPNPGDDILLEFFKNNWDASSNNKEMLIREQLKNKKIIDGVIEGFGKDREVIEDIAFPNENNGGAVNAKIAPPLSNPRAIKLYLNMIKFQYFMALTRSALTLPIPSPEQLDMWVKMQIKWPDITRWIIHSIDKDEAYEKLQFFQDEIPTCNKTSELKQKILDKFGADVDKMPGLNDKNFLKFYKNNLSTDIQDYAQIGLS